MRAATIKRKQEKESRQRERERVRLSVRVMGEAERVCIGDRELAPYEQFLEKDRREVEEYKRRKAEKKAGLRPGIREKSDGICRIM